MTLLDRVTDEEKTDWVPDAGFLRWLLKHEVLW